MFSTLAHSKTIVFAIVLLIVAKVLPILHIEFTNFYVDLDRIVALVVFLWVYFKFIEKPEAKPIMLLFAGLVASLFIGSFFDIHPERVIHFFFMTALVEEILLRGVFYHLLLKRFNSLSTLLIANIIFTILHPAIFSDYFYGVLVFLTGLILGIAYLVILLHKTRQLAVATVTVLHTVIILTGVNFGVLS